MKIREYMLPISVVLIILAIFSGSKLTGNVTKEAVVNDKDFENSEEGTLIIHTDIRVPLESDFAYLMFFSSGTIKGLRIFYDFKDSRLKAGLPVMSSEQEVGFDGNPHQIIYTFKKDLKQALYFDTVLVAEGPFDPNERVPLTGLAVYDGGRIFSNYIADGVIVSKEYLSQEKIKEVFG